MLTWGATGPFCRSGEVGLAGGGARGWGGVADGVIGPLLWFGGRVSRFLRGAAAMRCARPVGRGRSWRSGEVGLAGGGVRGRVGVADGVIGPLLWFGVRAVAVLAWAAADAMREACGAGTVFPERRGGFGGRWRAGVERCGGWGDWSLVAVWGEGGCGSCVGRSGCEAGGLWGGGVFAGVQRWAWREVACGSGAVWRMG